MSTVYILSDLGKLGKRDDALVLNKVDGSTSVIFPYKTDQLVIVGKISISGDAFGLISQYKIPVIFLSKNGKFNGRLNFGDSKNVFIRKKQYEILSDSSRSLEIARNIVTGKIKNEISFMQRIKRKFPLSPGHILEIEKSLANIKNNLNSSEKADDIEQLRGFEGMAARNYFSVFGYNILPEWAEFKTRSKNPPKSNVNAVLSFLYTLLMYWVESAVESQGLDASCGNLHALTYGKTSLVFDLMEEFRTPVVDTVCSSLFNLGVLSSDDFRTSGFSSENDDAPADGENYGIFLSYDGLNKVIAAFEDKMESQVIYPRTKEKMAYKKIIFQQAEHYRRVVMGEEQEYISFYYK